MLRLRHMQAQTSNVGQARLGCNPGPPLPQPRALNINIFFFFYRINKILLNILFSKNKMIQTECNYSDTQYKFLYLGCNYYVSQMCSNKLCADKPLRIQSP